ncbi:hypothetical protein HOY80DRAFT_959479 [Tuber brumale]|nr:hypothetical protein HOY80DRAFT_959479 [Tuber brumale]
MMAFVRNVTGFRLALAPFPHHFHGRLIRHHRHPGNGQLTSTSLVQAVRTQKYSTGDSTNGTDSMGGTGGTGSTGSTDELSDLANRVATLEKTCSSAIHNEFAKLKTELMNNLDESLEKSLKPVNDAINDARWWNRWILGTVVIGIMSKMLFYDKYVEEKLLKKIEDSESKLGTMIHDSEKRITKMVEDALSKFKLELKVAELEKEKMSDQDKKKR